MLEMMWRKRSTPPLLESVIIVCEYNVSELVRLTKIIVDIDLVTVLTQKDLAGLLLALMNVAIK